MNNLNDVVKISSLISIMVCNIFILLFRRIKIGKMAGNDVKFCFENRFFLRFLILICIEPKIFLKNFEDL